MITRLRVKNFKSLKDVDVELSRLSVLVGENGAGKSNVVDVLRFVGEALDHDLDHALRERGGFAEVLRRTSGHPTHVAIDVDVSTPAINASYGFKIAAAAGGTYTVAHERCAVHELSDTGAPSVFAVENGRLAEGRAVLQARVDARDLYLRAVSGVAPFSAVHRALRSIRVLNPSAGQLREYQKPDAAEYLARDGRNLASVVRRMEEGDPGSLRRAQAYLAKLVPGVTAVRHKATGPRETLVFKQVWDNGAEWDFFAASMSDGTLRAVALLIGVQQTGVLALGIEEPEGALHPRAARVLADALVEASERTQIVIATHAPDLLDHDALTKAGVFLVRMSKGVTTVSPRAGYLSGAAQVGSSTVGPLSVPRRLDASPGIEPTHTERSLFERDVP